MMATLLTLQNYRTLIENALYQALRLAFLQRPTVADLTALASLDVTRYPDGALVYVTAQTCVYALSRFSGIAAAPPAVIQPVTLPTPFPNVRWLQQQSGVTYGPNWRAPLHQVQSGPLLAVEIYSGDGGAQAMFLRAAGATPSLFLDEDEDHISPLSAGYPGSLYRSDLKLQAMIFTTQNRGAPASILGSPVAGEQPTAHWIIGQVRLVLAGIDGAALGLQGVDRVEIGDSQLVSEDEEERRYVHSAEIRVISYVRNPDLDLEAMDIWGQENLASSPPGGGDFDVLNYVAIGYDIAPGSGLSAQLSPGTAQVGGTAVSSAPGAVTLAASADTYCDLAGDGTVTYTAVPTGHDAPAPPDGALRLGVATTDATDVISWKVLCSYSQLFRASTRWV